MEYLMHGGILTEEGSGRTLARLKLPPLGEERVVLTPEGHLLLRAVIRAAEGGERAPNDVRNREYLLLQTDGRCYASARPEYAPEEDPDAVGWPVCRAPRVDRAQVRTPEGPMLLRMHSGWHYALYTADGAEVISLSHMGLLGGWRFHSGEPCSPLLLCGMFLFCRSLERENEFVSV